MSSSVEQSGGAVVDAPPADENPTQAQPTEPTTDAPVDEVAAKAPKTRLLKDVEEEERRYIYETLYKSIEDDDDRAVQDHLTVGDTVRFAKEAKAEFYRSTSLSVGDKLKEVVALVATMANLPLGLQKKGQASEPVVRSAASKQHNHKVLNIFVLVTVMMFTLPIINLFVGMHVIAPRLHMDPVLCGGFLSVATVLAISVGYVLYGLAEQAPSDVAAAQGKEALKPTEAKKKE